jgi:hypothetical protein
MPDPCPVCGTTGLHCYRGEPIDRVEWHRLADRERIAMADDIAESADRMEAWFGDTGRTLPLRRLAHRIMRGEENYP